jgi:beta-xylosidase
MKTSIVYLIRTLGLATCAAATLLTSLSAQTATPAASPVTWTDDFSSASLNSRWSWIREEPAHWSLTAHPGFLRIITQQTFDNVSNLLVQNAPGGDYEIRSRVVFTPTENFQIAGLFVYQDDSNSLMLGRAFCDGSLPACVNNGIYFDRVEGGSLVGSNFAMATTLQGDAYLRLLRHGNVYTGYVSTDGTNWTLVGAHTVTIAPTSVGLRASNQAQGAAEIPADFDSFTLIDNSRRLYLPLILK